MRSKTIIRFLKAGVKIKKKERKNITITKCIIFTINKYDKHFIRNILNTSAKKPHHKKNSLNFIEK